MTSRPLTLRPWQIAALQQHRLRMVVLPLRPQPEHRQVYYWRGKCIHDSEYRHWCWKGHVGADNWDDISTQLGPFLPFSLGDTLWVREGWQLWPEFDGYKPSEVGPPGKGDDLAVLYTADRPHGPLWDARKRSPVTMPRWASRYTLTAGPQTVKRLWEVTSADAIACGFSAYANSATIDCDTPDPRDDFRSQWTTDHGPGAWERNPWCLFAQVEEKNDG